jgi:hypothetical protein
MLAIAVLRLANLTYFVPSPDKKYGFDLLFCPELCPFVFHRTLPVPAYTLFFMYSHHHFLRVNRAIIFDLSIVCAGLM